MPLQCMHDGILQSSQACAQSLRPRLHKSDQLRGLLREHRHLLILRVQLVCEFPVGKRQPGSVYLFCKGLALVLRYMSWALSIGIANSTSWRVWEFDSDVIPVMFIGLWETFYVQTLNVSDHMVNVSTYAKLNESWVTPDEIYYGQNMVFLANLVTPISLVFASLAVWASWTKAPYPDFFRTNYIIAALYLLFSCFCITLTVSWNFGVDFYGQTTLEFPPNFPVGKRTLKSKRLSYVLPLGITAASLSLLSAVIFSVDRCSIKPRYQMKLKSMAKCLKRKV